ncbi:MAG: tetratricopeptide repeat-containing sensor histidine kinase [Bacteroidia bacterium]|nr:tetratricopeptide repeat-containing sensor histidine kinase [Bacteroidia bacterium]
MENLLSTMPDDTHRVKILTQLCQDYADVDLKKAIHFGAQSVELAEELGFNEGLADACVSMGRAYRLRGVHSQALDFFLRGLRIYEKLGNAMSIAKTKNNIAVIYKDQGDLDQALEYFEQTRLAFEQMDDERNVAIMLLNIGSVYMDMGELDTALQINEDGLSKAQDLGFEVLISFFLNNIGNIHSKKGEPELALPLLLKSLKMKQKSGNLPGVAKSHVRIAEAYFSLGKPTLAQAHLDSSRSLAESSDAREVLLDCYQLGAQIYESSGQPNLALGELRNFISLNDSLRKQNEDEKRMELQAAFDFEQQESEIKFLEQQRENRGTITLVLVIGLIILLLGLIGVLYLFYINRKAKIKLQINQHKINTQQKLILERNMELEDLNRERDGLINIVAHDLRSPINKSTGLLKLIELAGPLNEEQKSFIDMILQVNERGQELIADLLSLSEIQQGQLELSREKIDLQLFIEDLVTGYRHQSEAKNIPIDLDLPDENLYINSDRNAMTRILDNLLSNAMKFSQPQTRVKVSVLTQGEKIGIAIKDEGPGISEEEQKKLFKMFQKLSARPTAGEQSTGLGLAIVRELSNKLGGNIGVKSKLGEGTVFTFWQSMN